jgi:tRNA (adenine57-N1/adenine58-N1)-methyltransferase
MADATSGLVPAAAATASAVVKRGRPFSWERQPISADSPVVLLIKRGEITYANLNPDGQTHNQLGVFAHNDVLGKAHGETWLGQANQGSKVPRLHPLPATPELWTRALDHRTQIIYSLDISLIVFHLDLRPGSVVVETGTGSGSLSVALARTVAPSGMVHTFDFNAARVEAAQRDFDVLGVTDVITSKQGDAASAKGFGVDGLADAVFLDLPKPWTAIGNAKAALKRGVPTRLASFSPCIEQVSRVCEVLRAEGFSELRTVECISRELESYLYGRAHPVPEIWVERANEPAPQLRERLSFVPDESAGTCYVPTMNSHSGYLTFCSLFPKAA